MTQRVRDGLGLPAGIYRPNESGPTIFVPNGITNDGIESVVYANVVPVSSGYDAIAYDPNSGVYVPAGKPNPSPTHFNNEVAAYIDDVLHAIFDNAHPEGDFPYLIHPSESRANIVDDLATMKADFSLIW